MMPKKLTDFPDLTQNVEYQPTRRMALEEFPRQARIDHEMAIVRAHHERIAKAIELFWGHRDCVEYLQQLILSGGDGAGKARIGFKHKVLAALINLSSLHDAPPD